MKLKDVLLRDTRANQPSAGSSNEGYLYYVTDEDVLERSNGSAWQAYSSFGGIISCPKDYGTITAAATNYADSGGSYTSESDAGNVMVTAGLIKNLYVIFATNTVNTGNIVFTMRKNGSDQSVTCTATAGVTTTISDTTHSFSVAAGDIITIKTVAGGASGGVGFGFSYEIT